MAAHPARNRLAAFVGEDLTRDEAAEALVACWSMIQTERKTPRHFIWPVTSGGTVKPLTSRTGIVEGIILFKRVNHHLPERVSRLQNVSKTGEDSRGLENGYKATH